jgi:predicted outer membrane repeat protein
MLPRSRRALALLLPFAALATPALALDRVVGPGQCNEAGFAAVLAEVDGAGGGTISFACGTATIPSSYAKSISSAVTIDGGDRITFDGNDAAPFFQVYASADAMLRRLAFVRGRSGAVFPLENFGRLRLERITASAHVLGSGVVLNYGRLEVGSSAFTDNAVRAISNDGGEVVVGTSRFERNRIGMGTGSGGAAIDVASGSLAIGWSSFSANQAFDGGAIRVAGGAGPLRIVGASFSDNEAGYGGAIEHWGTRLEIDQSRFSGNHAQSGEGGAIWSLRGDTSIARSAFIDNVAAATGGAVSCYESAYLAVRDSAFRGNRAAAGGGAIRSTCALMVDNSSFSANVVTGAAGGGGAIHQDDPAHAGLVRASTLAGNSASYGGGISAVQGGVQTLFVGMSILAGNSGGNCAGVLGSNGYNLSSDTHCGGVFTATGDANNLALPLQPWGDYGGSTASMPPQPGNPAIDRVPLASCGPAADQRGALRPVGSACDSGAVELGGIVDLIFADGFLLPEAFDRPALIRQR